MSVTQIGQTPELDSGTLATMMKRLEKGGGITRKRSTVGERRVDVSLTKKSLDARDQIFEHVGSCMKLMNLPQSEYDHIKSEVARVDEHLSAIADNAYPEA